MNHNDPERRLDERRDDDRNRIISVHEEEPSPDAMAVSYPPRRQGTLVLPGLLIGAGLGGLLDGILFHRLLNWHHILTDDQPFSGDGVEQNLFADGLFDLLGLALVVVGLIALWAARPAAVADRADRSGVRLTGWILVGWAVFNLIEGVLNHLLLGLHHVREGDPNTQLAWDLGFLAVSLVIGVIGLAMGMRRDADREQDLQIGERVRRERPRAGTPGMASASQNVETTGGGSTWEQYEGQRPSQRR